MTRASSSAKRQFLNSFVWNVLNAIPDLDPSDHHHWYMIGKRFPANEVVQEEIEKRTRASKIDPPLHHLHRNRWATMLKRRNILANLTWYCLNRNPQNQLPNIA